MSLLTLVQSACRRLNLSSPTAVYSNADPQIQQLIEICNEEGQELSERYPWQSLRKQGNFTTVNAESQGTIEAAAPGFKYLINETMFDRTLRRHVTGPLTPQIWQLLKAQNNIGPYYQYTIRGNQILFNPNPTAGDSIYFEYITKNWASDSSGVTFDFEFNSDTDIALLDESIMLIGVIWRWKQYKGFEYGEDFLKYEKRVNDAMAGDGTKDQLWMGAAPQDFFPGILVPSGSWNV